MENQFHLKSGENRKDETMDNFSKHAITRSSQRGIPKDVVDIILSMGTSRQRPGNALEVRILKKDRIRLITSLRRVLKMVERSKNKCVITGSDGKVITLYGTD